MQLPIMEVASLVAYHAEVFRDLLENHRQFQHFENCLTGLMVLPNKGMSNIARTVKRHSHTSGACFGGRKQILFDNTVAEMRDTGSLNISNAFQVYGDGVQMIEQPYPSAN